MVQRTRVPVPSSVTAFRSSLPDPRTPAPTPTRPSTRPHPPVSTHPPPLTRVYAPPRDHPLSANPARRTRRRQQTPHNAHPILQLPLPPNGRHNLPKEEGAIATSLLQVDSLSWSASGQQKTNCDPTTKEVWWLGEERP